MQIGIIGCGRMGNERARATVALGHQVAIVYDLDSSKAAALADAYPGTKVLRLAAEIPWDGLDAVFICTPPSFRIDYELAAIEARLPFFVEKPIAVHASECASVLAALQRRPTLQAVGYMNRCRNSVRFARELLQQTSILGACCQWVGRKYQVDWWLQADQSGGPLNEQATHAFDLFRFLVGEISAVSSTMPNRQAGNDMPLRVACTVNFSAGQLGTLFYSCEAAEKEIDLRIITSHGVLELAGWDMRLVANPIHGTIPPVGEEDIFVSETAQFFAAVERNESGMAACDFFDAFQTQLAVDAARASLQAGKLVSIERQFHREAAV